MTLSRRRLLAAALSATLTFFGRPPSPASASTPADNGTPTAAAAAAAPFPVPAGPTVDVALWFDTEDYLLPACDDATKRLCELLDERGIRGTFKVVGEKARVMEKRGRTDVIAALKRHDVGYHSNFHSVHPTPTEYLADCGLLDGMAEFVRRESRGAADVRRVFGLDTLSCYGQPGSSWGPQTIAALKQIGVAPGGGGIAGGVGCYVDEGNHLTGFKGKPYWFCGSLVVYDMKPNKTRMDLHAPGALAPAEREFTAIADRLRGEGGGLISIYYHPSEWVHQEFWDGVNFRRGRNPPREEWVPPPQRPAAETAAAYERFAAYVDHMRRQPNVRFVVASDLPAMYPDLPRTAGVPLATVVKLAGRVAENARTGGGVDHLTVDGVPFSPADQFELIATAAAGPLAGATVPERLRTTGLLGPDANPPEKNPLPDGALAYRAFRDAAADALDYVRTTGRVPPRVYVGADAISPADFLVTLAGWYDVDARADKAGPQGPVSLAREVPVAAERHVAKDTPNLFGGWVIHKANFRAPKVLEVARQQAWTLKPAVRAVGSGRTGN
jgi:hypothetical protein